MNFENIQMPIARKISDGSKIKITQVNEENRHDKYECIVCGSEVVPVAPNGKVIGGKDAKVTAHFKHLDADRCGVESFKHFCAKTEFLQIGSYFKVVTDVETSYVVNQIFFEQTININGKRYTPDATVKTSCGEIIHFEFNYTNNKKIRDYIDKWNELKQTVIEVNIKDLETVFFETVPMFKALYYDGKIFNLKNDEDAFYYNTIGKYKVTKEDEVLLNQREIEIEKLDYLWDEIRQIKYNSKGYEYLGKLLYNISSEDSKKMAIEILSRIRCGDSILNNYISYLKDKVDRRLAHLNLKYDGYLIDYKIKIPKKLYERIYNGISIVLCIFDEESCIYKTLNDKFTQEDLLTEEFKKQITNRLYFIKRRNDNLMFLLEIFKKYNKINSFEFKYADRTDYIEAIFFKDYKHRNFIVAKNNHSQYSDIFGEYEFIEFPSYMYNDFKFYIIENSKNYKIYDRFYSNTYYGCKDIYNNILVNKSINFSFNYYKDYKCLADYDFITVTEQLKRLEDINIINFINKNQINNINKIDSDLISNKINEILLPIINLIYELNTDEINICLNREFTKGKPWLIKEFISELNDLGFKNINNII